MKYELLKQLKEAGFPSSESWTEEKGRMFFGFDDTLKPTLSELIEEILLNINYINGSFFLREVGYATDVEIIREWKCSAKFAEREVEVDGETPEESVARLWLQLNVKK